MELLIEFVGELLFEGIFEIIQNKKVPRIIRYPFIVLFIIIYGGLIFILSSVAVKSFRNDEVAIGILLIAFSLFLLIADISFFIKFKNKKLP